MDVGQQIQGELGSQVFDLLNNVDSVIQFINSMKTLVDGMVNLQKDFSIGAKKVIKEITETAAITEETSAATEEVLASSEEETDRSGHSIQALLEVNNSISKLSDVIYNKNN